jgi:hypothetical protein
MTHEATGQLLDRFLGAVLPLAPHRWAQDELMHRPVTPVTRRELHDFGLVLYGHPPAALLPAVTDEQVANFVVKDLVNFWRPALDHPEWWLRDIWVDLGLLTLARALVTLRTGRLITKAEALDVLTNQGAPAEVVDDIRQRRYGDPVQHQISGSTTGPIWRSPFSARRSTRSLQTTAPADSKGE